MNRAQLEHLLRAAATIVNDPDLLVVGSQSILGSYPEEELPIEATTSIEADLAFFVDPDGSKADRVDGAIGELSRFHETYGYYAQGVSVSTAVLPDGWESRTVEFGSPRRRAGSCPMPRGARLRRRQARRGAPEGFRVRGRLDPRGSCRARDVDRPDPGSVARRRQVDRPPGSMGSPPGRSIVGVTRSAPTRSRGTVRGWDRPAARAPARWPPCATPR